MAALEVVMENCGVELEWPCSSPPGPNSSAHCGLDAGDVDDVFAPAKESVNNSEGGGTNRRCTTATRKVSSEAGQHRIDSGTRRFRTRPLLPKLPVPPCDSGMSFVSESSPLNFTTSTSGYAGGRKRDSEWCQETERRLKRAWTRTEDHSAATLKKAMNGMGEHEVTLAQVKENSCKQPPHVRVAADPDSSLGEDVTTRSVQDVSLEDAACSQCLHDTMAQQMEVMKSVQSLLEEQCQMQAQIEAQHTNLIRMLAASKNTSSHPQPLEVNSEAVWRGMAEIPPACVGWSGPPRPESIPDLDPFRLLEEDDLEGASQEIEHVPAGSIDLQHLLLLHPDLLRHPHFLHQLLALSATTNGTPCPLQGYPHQQAMRQQEVGAVQVASAHEFQGVGTSPLFMQQLQRCFVEEQLKEQIRRQVQLQQVLLYQLAATQQSAMEMPTDAAPYLVWNAGGGGGGNGMGMGVGVGIGMGGLSGCGGALWG